MAVLRSVYRSMSIMGCSSSGKAWTAVVVVVVREEEDGLGKLRHQPFTDRTSRREQCEIEEASCGSHSRCGKLTLSGRCF